MISGRLKPGKYNMCRLINPFKSFHMKTIHLTETPDHRTPRLTLNTVHDYRFLVSTFQTLSVTCRHNFQFARTFFSYMSN